MVPLAAPGRGKTTPPWIVAGFETQTTGEVGIGDKRVDRLPPKDLGIAMAFQNCAEFPHPMVFESFGFGLRMHKLPNDEVTMREHRKAEPMHFELLFKRCLGELSGGQRQRVAVGPALATKPDVILVDEPLSNLDALLRLEVRAGLNSVLAESRTTATYVTRDQVEAMSVSDRSSVMHKRRIAQAATPIEVYRNPR